MPEAGIGLGPQTWDKGRWRAEGCLGRNIAGDYVSPWFGLDGAHPGTLTVSGEFEAVITAYVSNEQSNTVIGNDPQIGAPIENAPGSVMIDGPYKFLRYVVSNYTGGTIRSVDFFSRDRGAQN